MSMDDYIAGVLLRRIATKAGLLDAADALASSFAQPVEYT